MNTKTLFVIPCLLLLPFWLHADPTEILDPVIISPEQYQLKFENEYVRVVEYEILPGEKELWHTHPAKVAYVLSGGTLKVTTESGETLVAEEKQGEVRWMGAVGKHYGENIGDTPIKIILVEVKGVTENKTDIDSYLQEEKAKEK